MRMTDFLSPSLIRVPLAGKTKEEVIRELLGLIPLPDEGTRSMVFDAVMEREKLMSTGIGNGIAIPHGIVDFPMDLMGALGIPSEPIDFKSIDGRPVRLVFLLVADETDPGKNMKALARISRLLHREEFRGALMNCMTAEEAMQTLRDEEARHKI